MRPLYESQQDRDNEQALARIIEPMAYFDVSAFKVLS